MAENEPKLEPELPYIKRVIAIRLEPHLMVEGIRLRAKPREEQRITSREDKTLLGIGDAELLAVKSNNNNMVFIVRTFVWQHEMTLNFQELIDIFAEATLPLNDIKPQPE